MTVFARAAVLAVLRQRGWSEKLQAASAPVAVRRVDHPLVREGKWPAEALAITEAGRAACMAAGTRSRLRSDERRRTANRASDSRGQGGNPER